MNIYLIRHAEAVPLEACGVNADADRPLTEHGHAQCRALATAFLRHRVQLDLILTSPYLRARQTTQGLLDQWPLLRPRVEECRELAPAGKSSKIAQELRQANVEQVALVGHMPDLAEHAAWFIGSKKARIDLDKAGVALVESSAQPDKGTGYLIWLITPSWFL